MKTLTMPDIEIYPPFDGFPTEGIAFLRKLRKNNNRDWFGKHKSEYEENVKLPMQSFIASLKKPMSLLAPEIEVDPKRSLFRIYRDVRFSKNKDPYKTHVAAVFHKKGKWEDSAGFYVHIEPDEVYAGGGIYMPDSSQVKRIRSTIAADSETFLSIMLDKSFKQMFGALEGDRLKRTPIGYSSDHPMAEWLKFKSYYTGTKFSNEEYQSPRFVKSVMKAYEKLIPLIRFLNHALER